MMFCVSIEQDIKTIPIIIKIFADNNLFLTFLWEGYPQIGHVFAYLLIFLPHSLHSIKATIYTL
jgi:hypothetical protein